MNTNTGSNRQAESKENDGWSRRTALKTATAGAVAAGMSAILADATAASQDEPSAVARFGAPLVELHVPAGVLTPEQKRGMIEGITKVLITATKLPPEVNNQLWIQIFETAPGGWGFGGQVHVPRSQ
jgi:phenylpyruvate tautomerase PptA (4-oxalocrotonate tautomerase family)